MPVITLSVEINCSIPQMGFSNNGTDGKLLSDSESQNY